MNYIKPKNSNDVQEPFIDSYMAKSYYDKKFNSYKNGPGAALIDESGNQKRLLLCIKGAPSNFDEISLKRILCNYGNVISVHASKSEHCAYYFAECATENDFEAVLKGMQNNVFKMKVAPKTDKRIQNDQQSNNEEINFNPLCKREIDMSNRTIKGPFSNRQHPKLGSENTNVNNYDKEYGFNDKNILCPKIECHEIEEMQSRLNIIKQKSESSEGQYDSKEGAFIKFCDQFSLVQFKLHPCNTCKNLSMIICEKCKNYYCSIECRNHNNHRCYFSLISSMEKNLFQSEISVINKPIKAEMPKSGQTVIITHVEQTDMVYIRSIETENNDYIKIINNVEKFSQNAKFLTELPNINEYVVASYNGIWHRAIVLNNENREKIQIAYVDIGNNQIKNLSELKKCSPKCYKLKRYPFLIHLKNVEKCCPNDNFRNYMEKLVNSDTPLKIIYKPNDLKDNKIMAELYNVETNVNINNKCIELLKPSIPRDIDIPVMLEDIKKELLPTGENISLIIVSHSLIQMGIIHCISSSEVQELDDFNVEVQKYAESTNHHYTPRQGEMCIAKSDHTSWYRAFCCEIVGDGYPTLLFIDYGNVSPVSIENIRKYPKALTLPYKTDECSIFGLNLEPNENDEIVVRLRTLLPLYQKITVPKVECINNEIILHLPHIIDILMQEGLLKNYITERKTTVIDSLFGKN